MTMTSPPTSLPTPSTKEPKRGQNQTGAWIAPTLTALLVAALVAVSIVIAVWPIRNPGQTQLNDHEGRISVVEDDTRELKDDTKDIKPLVEFLDQDMETTFSAINNHADSIVALQDENRLLEERVAMLEARLATEGSLQPLPWTTQEDCEANLGVWEREIATCFSEGK